MKYVPFKDLLLCLRSLGNTDLDQRGSLDIPELSMDLNDFGEDDNFIIYKDYIKAQRIKISLDFRSWQY